MTPARKPSAVAAVSQIEVLEEIADAHNAASGTRKQSLLASLLLGIGGLGTALFIERGGSFFSSVLAARWGGAEVFGAYSVALTAANNVAWYAGSGIGNTSTRFIAEHTRGTKGYRKTIRSLTLIALVSAAVAAIALWLGAEPMARMLVRNEKLITPLRVAALSAAAIVLVECCRGVFIGTRNFGHLLTLSTLAGGGLLLAVPRAAKFGATYMIAGQSVALLIAASVSAFLIFRRSKGPVAVNVPEGATASLGSVWRFGLMQLGGVVGMNAAGWWTATLVTRADSTLVQMAFYAVATQLRNISSLIPSLVQQSNLAFFTTEGGRSFGGAARVVEVSSMIASILSTLCCGIAILVMPWIIGHMYGKDYTKAEMCAVLAIATVLVHFGTAPAASRLLMVSLVKSGIVNGLWAIFVVIVATLFVPRASAVAATATLFAGHTLSSFLVVFYLWRLKALPDRVTTLVVLDAAVALAMCGLAWARVVRPDYSLVLNFLILTLTAAAGLMLLRWGQRCGALPRSFELSSLLRSARSHLPTK